MFKKNFFFIISFSQNKLRQLDDKQQELIRDNLELKELCLYLDEERSNNPNGRTVCQACGSGVNGVRDDGDGSSSSTNADESIPQMNGQYNRVLQVIFAFLSFLKFYFLFLLKFFKI